MMNAVAKKAKTLTIKALAFLAIKSNICRLVLKKNATAPGNDK
jgi:hypothetical protein